jgi:hypothetical protein
VAANDEEYRGYRIVVRRQARGWQATIYAPNSQLPIVGPQSDDPSGREDVLQRARSLIDAIAGS